MFTPGSAALRRAPALLYALAAFLLVLSSPGLGQERFRALGAKDVKTIIEGDTGAVIVDARTGGEYDLGHLPGAVNVPPEKVGEIARYLPEDKDVPLIFYCRGVA